MIEGGSLIDMSAKESVIKERLWICSATPTLNRGSIQITGIGIPISIFISRQENGPRVWVAMGGG